MLRQPQLPLSVAWTELLGRLAIILIGLALVSGCVSRVQRLDAAPRKTTLAADRVALPSVFTKGRPYIDLSVNGHGPYRFLVDTGAEGTLISRPVADEAGIGVSRKYWAWVTGASGQAEHQPMGIVARLEAPGVTLRTVAVTIMPPQSAALFDPPAGKFIGGIIGMSALRDVRLEIDYPGKKVGLLRLDTETPPAGAGIAYTGNRPHVTIATPSSRHTTTTAVIDTGAEGGFEFTDIASYPLRIGLAKAERYSFGIGGYWRPHFGQLVGDIDLGSITWRDAGIESAPGNRIGSAALATLKLVIDPQKRLLWLLPADQVITTKWTGPLEPDGGPSVFGFVPIPKGDSIVINEVDPGSRAERAGLKVGDVVLPQDEDALALERVRKKDPYLARMRIARGEKKLEITMSLSDPLPVEDKLVR